MINEPLFNILDKKEESSPGLTSSSSKLTAGAIIYSGNSLAELTKSIDSLEPGTIVKYKSQGSWSMHELVSYILEQTGPADVYLSTWTISEDPARCLFNLKQKGLIRSLSCLFDYRIKVRAGEAFQLISSIADNIKLLKCHAKAAVIINDDHAVSVIGSSNFSKNPRVEAGTVFIDRTAAYFDRDWIMNLVDDDDID